ncbi:ATP-dependent protease La type I [Lachnospiraceae bacterium KM106-2]|nr:ATP-dependent protease La type I [Lachnospiraceae bacterium KM106-2]
MIERNERLPLVALRGLTVIPGMLMHFDVSRKVSIEAINKAMDDDQRIILVAQRDPEVDEPKFEDLYSIGTLAEIKQVIKLPNDILRVVVTAKHRSRLLQLEEDKCYLGEVEHYIDSIDDISEFELNAMVRSIKDILEVYCVVNDKFDRTVAEQLLEEKDLSKLLDSLAANLPIPMEEKQMLLEEVNLLDRFDKLAVTLTNEIEITKYRKEFQQKVKSQVDKNQKEYLLREQLKVIREELGESNAESDADEFSKKIEELNASDEVKERLKKEVERFKNTSSNSSESAVIRGYIETLLALPWNKVSKDKTSVKNAKKVLNARHYGMEDVKDRILDFLAVRSLTGKGTSPIICLVGPPGTGKTSIARSVADALNKEYVRISLGGVRDEAEIRGHRKTYVGAMPGRIVTALKSAGVSNPLMLLDEIDKVSNDYKGDTFSALLEVLDGEQNKSFVDHYLELPVDLSEVFFVATANSLQTIPRPLLDRMEIIEVSSYTENEKLHIAKEHLLPKQIEKNGLKKDQLAIQPKAMTKIIQSYTREAGVRNLERTLSKICRKAARQLVEEEATAIKVTTKNLKEFLGKEKYSFEMKNKKDDIGLVRGLAWTSVGGDTLEIEVNVMPGKGGITLTGKLGDVMKESASIAMTYIRSIASDYDVDPQFFAKHDIHIHVPEGAVPKDGPSAGITMATAILSAVTKKKVRADVAMTGEVTLRGRVLPIGGLKEKLLAAKNAGIKLVLVPKQNEKDVEELSDEILDGIQVKFVSNMQQVLSDAIC